MKKSITCILLVCFVLSGLFAAGTGNNQKIYSVTDPAYGYIADLSILSGKSLPYSDGPWTGDELLKMLSLIDYDALPEVGQALYDSVKAELTATPKRTTEDGLMARFGADFTLEGYYHTGAADFTQESDWVNGYADRSPLINFTSEFWARKSFYLYFEATVKDRIKDNIYDGTTGFGAFTPNFTMLLPAYGMFDNFEWIWPQKALASVGGEGWNIVMGRDRLSWGSGLTGNLMLSDDFPSHTFVKYSTYFDSFKYSLLGSFYPYFSTEDHYDPATGRLSKNIQQQANTFDGYKSLIVHRLNFKFGEKVNLAVDEACMFLVTEDNDPYTLLLVNPFGFMHNEYAACYGNSLLVFEADYTPVNGVNVYGQFAVDEIQFGGEGPCLDHCFGVIAGAKGVFGLGDGILSVNGEFAKLDPFMYLRGKYYDDGHEGVPGTAWSSHSDYGYQALFRSGSAQYDQNLFITYPYGGDVIVASAKAEYEVADFYKANAGVTMIKHGVLDAYSNWGFYSTSGMEMTNPEILAQTPTTSNPFDASETGEVETQLIISLGGEIRIIDGLTASLNADFVTVTNHNNVLSDAVKDIQITAGLTYSL